MAERSLDDPVLVRSQVRIQGSRHTPRALLQRPSVGRQRYGLGFQAQVKRAKAHRNAPPKRCSSGANQTCLPPSQRDRPRHIMPMITTTGVPSRMIALPLADHPRSRPERFWRIFATESDHPDPSSPASGDNAEDRGCATVLVPIWNPGRRRQPWQLMVAKTTNRTGFVAVFRDVRDMKWLLATERLENKVRRQREYCSKRRSSAVSAQPERVVIIDETSGKNSSRL